MTRLRDFALRAPKTTLILAALLTAALGFFARSVRVDGSLEPLLPDTDPERVYFAEVENLFGAEDVTIVGVFADDVFRRSTLEKIDRLSRAIGDLDGVRQVVSLTTVQNVESDDEGLHVGRLIRELPETAEAANQLRDKALSNRLYLRNVVAPDARAAGLTVIYQPMTDEEFERRGLEARVREIIATMEGPERFAVAAVPMTKVHGDALRSDIQRLAPWAILAIAFVLVISLRSLRGAVVSLAVALIGVVWTVGLMALTGGSINLATLPLPLLPLAVGLASSLQLVARAEEEAQSAGAPRDAVSKAMSHVGVPLVVSAVVTAIGFGPLVISPLRAAGVFGVYSIAGLLVVLLACFTVAPAALTVWPSAHSGRAGETNSRWVRILDGLGGWVAANRRLLFFGTVLAALVCVLGVIHLDAFVDDPAFFGADSPMRGDAAAIEQHLAGTQPIYLVVDGDAPGSVTKLKALQAIKDLQKFVAQQPGVDTTMSLLDYLGLLRHALDAGDADSMPQTQEEVDQLFLFANPEDMKPLVNSDRSRANMVLRTTLSNSRDVGEFLRKVEEFSADRFPRGIALRATGSVVLLNRAADAAVHRQISGLAQVVGVLFVALSALYLSLRIGLLALVPVAFPALALLGLMGWADLGLDLSTSMVAILAIALSIVITVHFFGEFNGRARSTGDHDSALLRTTASSGRVMFVAATALVAGLLTIASSDFPPLRQLGFLAALAVGLVLLVCLLLLPAVVASVRLITLGDLLALDLGPEPHQQIPLFAGLRPFQAKIVVLMARKATALEGAFLTRRGETSEELFVLLSGQADVYHDDAGGVVRRLARGEVIGEVGLVRRETRAADVLIREDVEYLALDGQFLKRVERRYPRIAAIVLLNLARILSDRLESTTEALGDPGKR